MNDNGGCALFALLLLAVSFPFAVKRPIEPGGYVFGALIYGATAIWLGVWLNTVATESERKKRIQQQNDDLERKRNSPEGIAERKAQEEAVRKANEEREQKRLEKEEFEARSKWVRYYKAVRVDELDQISGVQFEGFVKTVFERRGFTSVRMTPASGDQGGDLVGVSPDGKKVVVQAKRWKGVVGNQAVQELLGALLYYDGELGFVVTNSRFTDSARQLAQKDQRIQLIDRDTLSKWIEETFPADIPEFNWETYNAKVKHWYPRWSV